MSYGKKSHLGNLYGGESYLKFHLRRIVLMVQWEGDRSKTGRNQTVKPVFSLESSGPVIVSERGGTPSVIVQVEGILKGVDVKPQRTSIRLGKGLWGRPAGTSLFHKEHNAGAHWGVKKGKSQTI